MGCVLEPLYANQSLKGCISSASKGDGYTIEISWVKAVPNDSAYQIAYNIYYSTIREDVFSEGVKYVVLDSECVSFQLTEFTPGDVYYFAVRATMHEIAKNSLSQLPQAPNGLYLYPEAILINDITDSDTTIEITDIALFPAQGIIQIGSELIYYSSTDQVSGTLLIPINGRGYLGTVASSHTTDGYDGYDGYVDPLVRFFTGWDDRNVSVQLEENKFDYPNYAWTSADGYAEIRKDILTTDLTSTEADQADFSSFDFAGWRRTDQVALLDGKCVGSYYGGEFYCADGYEGIGRQIRGLSIDEINNQRQELLLTLDGEPVVLVKRIWKGKRCKCVISSRETPEPKCPFCLGTGFQIGYEQYYNAKRSDGRIMMRFSPSVDDLIPQEAGLDPKYEPNAWTLSVPAIKDRDFIIRFNKDGTEEFRYEILNVTRNKILLDNFGAQQTTLARIRKTDPIYMFKAFRDTSSFPSIITTSIGLVAGPGGIPPHTHSVKISEKITNITQINEVTSFDSGHSHEVRAGQILDSYGHLHSIIFP